MGRTVATHLLSICDECEDAFCPTCETPHTCSKCGRVYCGDCAGKVLDSENVCDLCRED
ncbi:hypothetical protein LCGC14_1646590, partial [marine sediment metagenome]